MSHLPWFPFFYEDWRSSRKVRAMPRHTRSMFLDLLGELWRDGSVPDDEQAVCELLEEDPKTFGKSWAKIRVALFEVSPGRLSSHFLEDLREQALAKSKKQSDRAKSGWKKRRQPWGQSSGGDGPGMPRHSGGDAISDLRSQSKDLPPARARVIDLDQAFGAGAFSKLWIEVMRLSPTGDTQRLYQVADRVVAAAEMRDRRPAELARELMVAFDQLVEGWKAAKGPAPQRSVEAFERNFAACEEVVDGRRDPKAKRVDRDRPLERKPLAIDREAEMAATEALIARSEGRGS